MRAGIAKMFGVLEMLRYAAISIAGKHFYLILLAAPIWVGALWLFESFVMSGSFHAGHVQVVLVGIPLVLLATFLGLRIIASEISGRSLEIVYTVPGGCERVWWTKLLASVFILLPFLILLSAGVWLFITDYPLLVLQGALQSGLFFLVLSMGFSVLFKSEIAGALATGLVFIFCFFLSDFGSDPSVLDPFYNPFNIPNASTSELIATTVQNRVGFLLFTFAILGLAFMRSNRRERLLSG